MTLVLLGGGLSGLILAAVFVLRERQRSWDMFIAGMLFSASVFEIGAVIIRWVHH